MNINSAGWLGFNGTFSTNRPYRAISIPQGCYTPSILTHVNPAVIRVILANPDPV